MDLTRQVSCCENAEKYISSFFIPEVVVSNNSSSILLQDDSQLWMAQLCQSPAPELLICITVYNEPSSALLYSLAGIKQNLDDIVRVGKRSLAERVTICLIFDGQETVSDSTLALLKSLKLHTGSQPVSEAAMHIFDAQLDFNLVERCIDDDMGSRKLSSNWWDAYQFAFQQYEISEPSFELESKDFPSPRVLTCIKRENAGKLNSHWWFFKVLSATLQPKYCVQMDVGSVPGRNAISELWNFLEMHPEVAAATGAILVPEPHQFSHALSVWQFGNFFLGKLLAYPSEAMAGYLSVLPGQFSMFRWQALAQDWTEDLSSSKELSPLDRYFRGLGQLGAFESTMYLTEDRILGFELITAASPSWKLAFLPSVSVVTDPCQSLPELLRQRRRWINGCLACRVWSFAQIPRYISKAEVSISRKCQFLSSVPLYLLKLVIEWFFPAFAILLDTFIYKILKQGLAEIHWASGFIDLAFVLHVSLSVAQLLFCQSSAQYSFLLKSKIIYEILFFLSVLVIFAGIGCDLPLYIVGFLLLSIFSIAKVQSQTSVKKLFSSIILYFLINPAYTFLLYAHAFYNIQDRSWGTKGLTKVRSPEKEFEKNYCYIFWLLSNLCVLIVALSFQSLIPILVLFGQLDFIISILAGGITAIAILKTRYLAKNSS